MTDHPTDTDIIAAHQQLPVHYEGPDGYCTTCGDPHPCEGWNYRGDCTCGWEDPPPTTGLVLSFAYRHAAHVAEALTAARRVETIDELDALPIGTVVLTASPQYEDHEAFTRWSNKLWAVGGSARLFRSYEIVLPVRILYRPDSEDPS